MRKSIFVLCCAVLACAAGPHRSYSAEVRARIRAVTAFIEIDPANYAMRIQEGQKFLATAKEALNKAGFEGAGGRITTQPFPQYTTGMKNEDAVTFNYPRPRVGFTKASTPRPRLWATVRSPRRWSTSSADPLDRWGQKLPQESSLARCNRLP